MTKRRVARLLAEIAAEDELRDLQRQVRKSPARGRQAKSRPLPPDCVEVPVLWTRAQAQAFARFLAVAGDTVFSLCGARSAADAAEMSGAAWALRRQLHAVGIKETPDA